MTIFLGLLGNRSAYILCSDTDSPFHFTLMCPILDNKLKFHSIYAGLPPSVGTRLEKGVQWIWNREPEEIPQTIFQREKKKVEILKQPAQIHTASAVQSGVECRQCESS